MSGSRFACSVFALGLWAIPGVAAAEEPILVVEESLPIPAGLDPHAALDSLGDIAEIFRLYQPSVPKIPSLNLNLAKEVLSASAPAILEIPVTGSALGYKIDEIAHITATEMVTACTPGGIDGRTIVLDFDDSTYNVERRIDRIEIVVCLVRDGEGVDRLAATGSMYAGYKPKDPLLNRISESVGAKAFQVAFMKQVGVLLKAVQLHWGDLNG